MVRQTRYIKRLALLGLVLYVLVSNATLLHLHKSELKSKATRPSKRAFVCLTGQLSRLELGSKINNVFRPMSQRFEVDVAIVLADTLRFSNPNVVTALHEAEFLDKEHVVRTLQQSGAVTHIDYNNHSHSNAPLVSASHVKNLDKPEMKPSQRLVRAENHVHQMRSKFQCDLRLQLWQEERQMKYDLVVWLREDVIIGSHGISSELFNIPENTVVTAAMEAWNFTNDKAAFLHPSVRKVFFSYPLLEYVGQQHTFQSPEIFLSSIMDKYEVKVIRSRSLLPAKGRRPNGQWCWSMRGYDPAYQALRAAAQKNESLFGYRQCLQSGAGDDQEPTTLFRFIDICTDKPNRFSCAPEEVTWVTNESWCASACRTSWCKDNVSSSPSFTGLQVSLEHTKSPHHVANVGLRLRNRKRPMRSKALQGSDDLLAAPLPAANLFAAPTSRRRHTPKKHAPVHARHSTSRKPLENIETGASPPWPLHNRPCPR